MLDPRTKSEELRILSDANACESASTWQREKRQHIRNDKTGEIERVPRSYIEAPARLECHFNYSENDSRVPLHVRR